MGEEKAESADLERSCHGISPGAAGCTYPATLRLHVVQAVVL